MGHDRLFAGPGTCPRRAFLQAGILSAFGLSLADYFSLRPARGATAARARSVLLIYTMGGISHHDSFDPKPDAPAEVRGEFKPIPTKLPGVHFCEHLPHLARQADKFSV